MLHKKAPTPLYAVTAGIVRRNGRVLVAQRPADKLLGGLWEFPGGKLEPGESLDDCLRRELREELGIQVAVGRQVLTLKHAYTHFSIRLSVFECSLSKGDPRPLQVAALKWARPADLGNFAMGKTDRQIAEWVQRRNSPTPPLDRRGQAARREPIGADRIQPTSRQP